MNTGFYHLPDEELIQLWGKKLKQLRLDENISQNELSTKTGMSRSSIAAIENGRNFSVNSLISILRALNQLEILDYFFREQEIALSPMEMYRKQRKLRKRGGYRK